MYSEYKKNGLIKYGDDRFRVEEIKTGGFGIIYFCMDLVNNRRVIIKSINKKIWDHHRLEDIKLNNPDLYNDLLTRSFIRNEGIHTNEYIYLSFFREAKLIMQMTGCPGIPQGYRHWVTKWGQPFLVMERLYGKSLDQVMQNLSGGAANSGMSVLECIHIAISVCNTMLQIAKEVIPRYCADPNNEQVEYFVHRDIKPANLILAGKNEVKLIDFGTAKFSSPADMTILAEKLINIGDRRFCSPEQLLPGNFEHVDPKTDIYSLGATLYHLCTGQDLIRLPLEIGINDLIAKASPDFSKIIIKCLQYDPARRYLSFEALKGDLVSLVNSLKRGSTEIDENARCSKCGYIARKHIDFVFMPVAEGEFLEGCSDADLGKLLRKFPAEYDKLKYLIPLHEESGRTAAYEISQTPVTNQQYWRFLTDSGYLPYPEHWYKEDNPPYDPDMANHPVVGISYLDALEFCKHYGFRIPTGSEWERAARGDATGQWFPWTGDEFNKDACNCAESGSKGLVSVYQYDSFKSPYGCLQMVGNVWEWIDQTHPDSGDFLVYKFVVGGSFAENCQVAGLPCLRDVAYPVKEKHSDVGFRVVRDHVVPNLNQERCHLCEGDYQVFEMNSITVPVTNLVWGGFF